MLTAQNSSSNQGYEERLSVIERLLAAGEVAEAIKNLDDYVQKTSASLATAMSDLAALYHGIGQRVPVIVLLERAVTLRPGDRDLRKKLALALATHGMGDAAISHLEPLLADTNPDEQALVLAGDVRRSQSRVEDATRYYEAALRVNPQQSEARAALVTIRGF